MVLSGENVTEVTSSSGRMGRLNGAGGAHGDGYDDFPVGAYQFDPGEDERAGFLR
jgi:hypothetical protein